VNILVHFWTRSTSIAALGGPRPDTTAAAAQIFRGIGSNVRPAGLGLDVAEPRLVPDGAASVEQNVMSMARHPAAPAARAAFATRRVGRKACERLSGGNGPSRGPLGLLLSKPILGQRPHGVIDPDSLRVMPAHVAAIARRMVPPYVDDHSGDV
jgi:hypothetical protein